MGGFGGFIIGSGRTFGHDYQQKKHILPTLLQKTPKKTTTNNADDENIEYGNVRVDIRYDKNNKGLKWLIEDSYFQDFKESFGYSIKMNILPQGIELSRLRIKVTLF